MAEYIEREAAILLPYLPKEHREYQTFNLDDAFENGWDEALKYVALMPAADVRPVVRGEWVQDLLASTGGGSYAVIRCSICGWAYPMIETHFCPCCGADMRKEGKP